MRVAAAALLLAVAAPSLHAQYRVLGNTVVGGAGGWDYVYADPVGRKLYIPRSGETGRVTIFNLDTLAPAGDFPAQSAHGVAIDQASGHGFVSSKPVVMFDSKTEQPIKTIDVQGAPDGIFADPGTHRVFILSHRAPNVTVLNASDGMIAGTFDLPGAPEQAAADGKGHLFIDIEDKGSIAVVDTASMKMTGSYALNGTDGCTGLVIDAKNGILFATCNEPAQMVILKAADGTILTKLPIGKGTDGASWNPATMEAFTAQGDGTLSIVKESSPTTFAVEQTVTTPPRARTITFDEKTGKVFTVTAKFGPAPPLAPGQRYSRPPMLPDTFTIVTVGK